MKYAFDVAPFGSCANPKLLAELARDAEDSGWDGFFIWDHIQAGWPEQVADPWIALAAIAVATNRIRLGALVTPLFRRSPYKVARETVTLDHLCDGRLILGVGLGTDIFRELSAFGLELDDRTRAAMLDESLAVLLGLWSGRNFTFEGKYYQVHDAQFLPTPVQQPRVPIWVAGTWPNKRPFRRAARFDGVAPIALDFEKGLTPAETRALVAFVKSERHSDAPFDVTQSGETPGESAQQDREIVAPYAEAGATWWCESPLPWKSTVEQIRARIRKGPPRV